MAFITITKFLKGSNLSRLQLIFRNIDFSLFPQIVVTDSYEGPCRKARMELF